MHRHLQHAVAAASLLAAGCAEPEAPPLSGLLITLDTTRADALSCLGAPGSITPRLDRLAAESVLYDSSFTVAPITLPSHASMLSGLYPLRHTVRTNGANPLPESAHTLAEAARDGGLQTAAFVAAVVLDADFGLDQGFDVYDAPRAPLAQDHSYLEERPADQVVDGALRWLEERDRSRRFFLWVHLFDPHGPYQAPEAFRARSADVEPRVRGEYLAEVAMADHHVGRLLDALREGGSLDETLVVVVADHGEGLGDHGEYSHAGLCFQSTMHVPLLVRDPAGERAGERSEELVSVVDVYPTLAEGMGVPVPPDVDGVSLFRRAAPADRGVYFESYYGYVWYDWRPLAGWADERGKYLHGARPRLYDWRADPSETRDLAAERAGELERYRDAIARLAARPALEAEDAGPVSQELQGRIQALGYAGGGVTALEMPHPLAPSERPDAHDRVNEQRRLLEATELANAGRHAEALDALRPLVAASPRNFAAVDRLAFCLMRTSRHAEALEPLRRALADDPPRPDTHCYLGACLLATGQLDEARAPLARALDLDPDHGPALGLMAELLTRLGRDEEAARFRARYRELAR